MNRVRELELHRRRIDGAFSRAARLAGIPDAEEVQSDYARFICVLVSGWVEKSVAAIILAHASGKTSQPLISLLEAQLRRLTNVTTERLLNTMGGLDKGWRDELQTRMTDEQAKALNSVVGLRNDISHGGGGTLTLRSVKAYWDAIQVALDHFEELLLGSARPVAKRARKK